MSTEKQEIHTYGLVQGLVIGEGNTITLVYQRGEQRTVPFLAPPRPPYDLVGRNGLLRDLKGRLFAQQQVALSALNGLPGVGKTALAVTLAYDPEVLDHFSDGVLWAGLGRKARQTDTFSLLGTWGASLGIALAEMEQLSDLASRRQRIKAAIGQRKMLLVADDAWQVEVARHFNIGGPNCAFLVTTRLPTVAVDLAGDGMMVVHELNEDDGLILLRKLAIQAVDAEPNEARALVRAVGGLPLALTLMGRYLRRQASSGQPRRVREALDRLRQVEERLKLDEPQVELGYHPGLPESTPVSLQAVIAMSDEALDESSHETLMALSVFPSKPNTFSEEAAVAVSMLLVQTLDTLTDYGLLESSGSGRYMLHQTIADYAIVNRTNPAVEERMVEYFASFTAKNEKIYEILEQEVNNIQAAFQIASKRGMHEALIREANTFYPFLESRGLYVQAEGYLKRAQESALSLNESISLVTSLLNSGRVMEKKGDYTQAESYFQKGLGIARQINHRERICALLQNLGGGAFYRGEYAEAESYFREGLEIARQIGHREHISHLLQNLGVVAFNRGEYAQTKAYWQEGLEIARQINHRERICALLQNLGAFVLNDGEYAQAESYYQEGLKIAHQIGHRERISALLQNLGVMATQQGSYAQAEAYLQEGLEVARQLGGHRERISHLLQSLGDLTIELGEYAQAEAYLQEGLEIARQLDYRERVIDCLLSLGVIATRRGSYAQAESYFREGLEIARQIGHREHISHLLQSLGDLTIELGEYAQAEVYLQEGLEIARQLDNRIITANILYHRGRLYLKMSQPVSASQVFFEALEAVPKESLNMTAHVEFGLAQVEASLSNYERAMEHGQASLTIFEKMGHQKASEVRQWLALLPAAGHDTKS